MMLINSPFFLDVPKLGKSKKRPQGSRFSVDHSEGMWAETMLNLPDKLSGCHNRP